MVPRSQGSWGAGQGPPRRIPGRFWDSVLCPQVVGNLLYYRFLNPAIVAPDAFDIVAMAAGGALATPQRHTLGAVAQVLQHAAAGKVFSGESRHLRALNDYLEETHLKFRSWSCPIIPSCPLFLLFFLWSCPTSLPGVLGEAESADKAHSEHSEPEGGLLGWRGPWGGVGVGGQHVGVLPASPPLTPFLWR